jgi:hypothetical protein
MEGSGSVKIITDPYPEAQKLTEPGPEHCSWENIFFFKEIIIENYSNWLGRPYQVEVR